MKFLFLLFVLPLSAMAVVRIDQGLNQLEIDQLYHEYEGSQLMPLKWFLALEEDNSQRRFVDGLGRFGILSGDEKSSNKKINPFDLPVGFAVTHDERTAPLYGDPKWVGVNCAACHTSKFEVNGQDVIVEGGANLFDLDEFGSSIQKSVAATLSDDEKFVRFQKKVGTADPKTLRVYLEKFKTNFGGYLDRNKYTAGGKDHVRLGPERMDGLGIPNNESTCHLDELGDLELRKKLLRPENCKDFPSFTGVPAIWGTFFDEFTHFAGAIHSSIGRNVGQASGVLAKFWVTRNDKGEPVFQTSTSLKGLRNLENWYGKVRAPEWDQLVKAKLVEKLNPALVQKGRELYSQKNCISCHALKPENTEANVPLVGRKFFQIEVTPLEEIGTDPARVLADIEQKVVLPPVLRERYERSFAITPGDTVPTFLYRSMIVRELVGEMLQGLGPLEKMKAASCRITERIQHTVGYKARSLEGVIFTPPFLHNSSVPTLDDLFKPATQRPLKFYTGCRKLDLNKGGLDCLSTSENSFLIDTTQPGAGNQGHEYGTDMTPHERRAMIEFLKSIRNPKTPSMGLCQL